MPHFLVFLVVFLHVARASLPAQDPWPYPPVYPSPGPPPPDLPAPANCNASRGRAPLYFALMLSFEGEFTSADALPGVQIALDYVNNQPSILPGYTLHYTLTNSRVNRPIASHLYNKCIIILYSLRVVDLFVYMYTIIICTVFVF